MFPRIIASLVTMAFIFTPLEISYLQGDFKFLTGLTQCGLGAAAPIIKDRAQNLRPRAAVSDGKEGKVAAVVGGEFKLTQAAMPASAGRVDTVAKGTGLDVLVPKLFLQDRTVTLFAKIERKDGRLMVIPNPKTMEDPKNGTLKITLSNVSFASSIINPIYVDITFDTTEMASAADIQTYEFRGANPVAGLYTNWAHFENVPVPEFPNRWSLYMLISPLLKGPLNEGQSFSITVQMRKLSSEETSASNASGAAAAGGVDADTAFADVNRRLQEGNVAAVRGVFSNVTISVQRKPEGYQSELGEIEQLIKDVANQKGNPGNKVVIAMLQAGNGKYDILVSPYTPVESLPVRVGALSGQGSQVATGAAAAGANGVGEDISKLRARINEIDRQLADIAEQEVRWIALANSAQPELYTAATHPQNERERAQAILDDIYRSRDRLNTERQQLQDRLILLQQSIAAPQGEAEGARKVVGEDAFAAKLQRGGTLVNPQGTRFKIASIERNWVYIILEGQTEDVGDVTSRKNLKDWTYFPPSSSTMLTVTPQGEPEGAAAGGTKVAAVPLSVEERQLLEFQAAHVQPLQANMGALQEEQKAATVLSPEERQLLEFQAAHIVQPLQASMGVLQEKPKAAEVLSAEEKQLLESKAAHVAQPLQANMGEQQGAASALNLSKANSSAVAVPEQTGQAAPVVRLSQLNTRGPEVVADIGIALEAESRELVEARSVFTGTITGITFDKSTVWIYCPVATLGDATNPGLEFVVAERVKNSPGTTFAIATTQGDKDRLLQLGIPEKNIIEARDISQALYRISTQVEIRLVMTEWDRDNLGGNILRDGLTHVLINLEQLRAQLITATGQMGISIGDSDKAYDALQTAHKVIGGSV